MNKYLFGSVAMLFGAELIFALVHGKVSAQEKKSFDPYVHEKPFEAKAYVPPPSPKSHLNLRDNGDGTITDPDAGLMWTQADSHADLNKCLNWHDATTYVQNLTTGNYGDWRLPTLMELVNLHDNTKENSGSVDHDPEYPLGLDEKFADGAAYWYWSSNYEKTDLTDCCARTLYFVTGMGFSRRLTACTKGGVRAVRSVSKK